MEGANMNLRALLLFLIVAVLAMPLAAAPRTAKVSSDGPNGKFELSVSVSGPETGGSELVCTAEVWDLTRNERVAAPKVIVAVGHAATVETAKGDTRLRLTVTSQQEKNEVLVSGQLTRDGAVVFEPTVILAPE